MIRITPEKGVILFIMIFAIGCAWPVVKHWHEDAIVGESVTCVFRDINSPCSNASGEVLPLVMADVMINHPNTTIVFLHNGPPPVPYKGHWKQGDLEHAIAEP